MIIKAITIENFKGIKDPVRVELKPITLLFGPNSAGKSTIIQAIHYAREIFERGNSDPGRTLVGGESIDLGGFESLVYKHDKNKCIKLKFEIDLKNKTLPDYVLGVDDPLIYGWEESNLWQIKSNVKSASVEITIKWCNKLQNPIISKYEVSVNGEHLATIETGKFSFVTKLTKLNANNSIFWKDYEKKEEIERLIEEYKNSTNSDGDIGIDSIKKVFFAYYENSPMFALLCEMAGDHSRGIPGITSPILLGRQMGALPNWGDTLSFMPSFFENLQSDEPEAVNHVLSSLIVGPGELIRNALRDFCYLGPLRTIPPRNHSAERLPDETRWANGLAAWDILYQADDELLEKLSFLLGEPERFNTDYYVDVKKYRELEADDFLTKQILDGNVCDNATKFRDKFLNLPVKRRVVIKDVMMDIELAPQDIGIGISQVLPVLVASLYRKEGLVAIEQPELHIHPAWQVALGDIFIEQIREHKELFYILETHSEHILLRLLRRIRETSEKIASTRQEFFPSEVSIYFIERAGNQVSCYPIRVDEDGEFVDKWPKGFFNERIKELY